MSGGILRIAAALGGDGVIAGTATADPFAPRVLRVSMGAALRSAGAAVAEPRGRFQQLVQTDRCATRRHGARTDGRTIGSRPRVPNRFAILLGSEGHGLPPEIVALCHRKIAIPDAPAAPTH